jgi:glycosidase
VPGGDELPASFDFPLADAIRAGAKSGDASGIAAKLEEVRALYPQGAIDAPFLTNHDQVRLATQLDRNSGAQRSAAAVLLTVPGTPFLYYGEEVGLENGPTSGDESKRTPMPWDASTGGGFTTGTPWFDFAPGKDRANVAAEFSDAGSLLARYRALIAARHASKALTSGDLRVVTPKGVSPVLAFVRETGGERVLVAHNLSDAFVNGGPYDAAGASADPLFLDQGVLASGASGAWRVTLPPRASGVWRLR